MIFRPEHFPGMRLIPIIAIKIRFQAMAVIMEQGGIPPGNRRLFPPPSAGRQYPLNSIRPPWRDLCRCSFFPAPWAPGPGKAAIGAVSGNVFYRVSHLVTQAYVNQPPHIQPDFLIRRMPHPVSDGTLAPMAVNKERRIFPFLQFIHRCIPSFLIYHLLNTFSAKPRKSRTAIFVPSSRTAVPVKRPNT